MQVNVITTIALLCAFVAAPAMAAPKVQMEMKAEKEIVVVENGKQVKKRVEAKSQVSGEVIVYTIAYRNEGSDVATNVVIANKVPEGTSYIAESAGGAVDPVFSIDGAKSFAAPAALTYEVVNAKGVKERVVAPPEKYTDIRWVVPQVAAGASGQVSYSLRIK